MKTLGICWIAYGIFRLCMVIAAALLAPTATLMFGALLARVADPFTWMDVFHVLYVCWAGLCFIGGILAILGGLTLARRPNAGRGFLFAASFLALSDLPVGAAIGVYTLIVLISAPPVARSERPRANAQEAF